MKQCMSTVHADCALRGYTPVHDGGPTQLCAGTEHMHYDNTFTVIGSAPVTW
jgi:hypothetical protein